MPLEGIFARMSPSCGGEANVHPHILREYRAILADRGLVSFPEELQTYECSGLTNFRVLPQAVLLPESAEQVQGIVPVCHRERMPFVVRG